MIAVKCGEDVRFEGEEHIVVFDSSGWAARGFCLKCGTHLFYKLKLTGECIVPPACSATTTRSSSIIRF